jgi:hypothetical protein
MCTARCAASVPLAGNEAPHPCPLSTRAWSALTRVRPDVFVDGWLREASFTHLPEAGLDRYVVTAVFVRANGWFDQRTWWLTPEEMRAVRDASAER